MRFERMTGRSMLALVGMLGAYGVVTVSFVLAAYWSSGPELANLVATAAGSISVPAAGLLTLLVAWW